MGPIIELQKPTGTSLKVKFDDVSQILGDLYNKEDLCRLDAPYCLLVLGGLTLGLSVGGNFFICSSFLIFSYTYFFRKKSFYRRQKNLEAQFRNWLLATMSNGRLYRWTDNSFPFFLYLKPVEISKKCFNII